MVLSDEKIKEFQELCKEHFGIELGKEDASKNGLKLLQMISIIYRPKNNEETKTQAELLRKQK